jgi:hypothetical protein
MRLKRWQAWDSVASKSMFWDGANIFVMIVRGSAMSTFLAVIFVT